MLDGTGSSRFAGDQSASLGAPPIDVLGRVGASAQCEGMCLPAQRSATRTAAWHLPRVGAGCELGGCMGCDEASITTRVCAVPGGPECADAPAQFDVSPGRAVRQAGWHHQQVASGDDALGDPCVCGGSAAVPETSRGSSASLGPSQSASPQPARRGHPACRAPWHPEVERCAVPRAGPEDWARWASWGRAGTTSGHAPGSARALRLAQTHTVVCERCGDLVPLQKARTAARGAGRSCIAPSDGCYGCSRHSRKSRREERQGGMAMAILAGARALLETPPSAAARVELWLLPRSSVEAHARRVLARYQPQGLGRWLAHTCCHGP